ncbi:MAG: hypothetical protein DRI94_05605 [Bacteroidetes bacterium]|nr:MAG: hypothetical protein DRI94_05605 [Bacteroidota bacterium]
MIKNFNIKFLPVIILLMLIFYSFNIKAVEPEIKNKVHNNVEIESVKLQENLPAKNGFLKRFFKKANQKLKEIKRKIIKKIKRKVSKHRAKKDVMKGSLRQRNHNLFNILVFSGLFLLFAGGITALFYFAVISSSVFLVLSLILGITSLVIALIYFSGRYIVKPHFRS